MGCPRRHPEHLGGLTVLGDALLELQTRPLEFLATGEALLNALLDPGLDDSGLQAELLRWALCRGASVCKVRLQPDLGIFVWNLRVRAVRVVSHFSSRAMPFLKTSTSG